MNATPLIPCACEELVECLPEPHGQITDGDLGRNREAVGLPPQKWPSAKLRAKKRDMIPELVIWNPRCGSHQGLAGKISH